MKVIQPMYRPEIDGLRSIAVLPVIFYHAHISYFSGGFVGVDVFFVISGYLITGIILNDISKGKFSIATFYERRARRILPALFAVMLACIPFAWMWLLPLELKDFSQSIAAAALSVSNILFWMEVDYFAQGTELKPLLHTWSLGVEEQFYIFFPLLLLLMSRVLPRRQIYILIAIGLLSLFAAQYFIRSHTSMVFYLLPFRAWELTIGALCAYAHFYGKRTENEVGAAVGLGVLLLCIFFYDASMPFPGIVAAPPTIATALIILYAGSSNFTGRFLSIKPLTFIGLISYSAYLWHQPVLAFAQHYSPGTWSSPAMTALLILTFVLAWASWKYVETPFRTKSGYAAPFTNQKILLIASTVGILLFTAIGYFGHVSQGFPDRLTLEQRNMITQNTWSKTCLHTRLDPQDSWPDQGCSFNTEHPQKVALIGDSVASSIAPALSEYFDQKGYALYQFTHSYCTLNIDYVYLNQDALPCTGFMRSVVDYVSEQNFDLVITAGNYRALFRDGGSTLTRQDEGQTQHPTQDDTRTAALVEFKALAASLESPMAVIYPHPHPQDPILNFAVKRMRTTGVLEDYTIPLSDFHTDMEKVNARLDTVVPEDGFAVSPEDAFCDATDCFFIKSKDIYYDDDLHYSARGADLVVQSLDRALQENSIFGN